MIRPICGTHAGYALHQYHQEPRCQACKAAESNYTLQRRAAREVAAQRFTEWVSGEVAG